MLDLMAGSFVAGAGQTDACWVRNALLEAVGAERAEHNAGCAVEAADCPEWRHCV